MTHKTVKESKLVANRYLLIRKLGQGGMGAVYLARDTQVASHAEVALKFLASTGSLEATERFKNEFRVLTQIVHPLLARVYDFGFDTDRNLYFFTQEFLSGENLLEHTRGRKLSAVLFLFAQLAEALSHLHRHGILHNDLKPANAIVEQTGSLRLIDFGISAIAKESRSDPNYVLGTPGYLAPEVLLGKPTSFQSDFYSLGVVLFEIVTGKKPYADHSAQEIFHRALNVEFPTLRSVVPDVPEKLDEILSRLTARTPEQRPDNLAVVLYDLEKLTGKTLSHLPKTEFLERLEHPQFLGRENLCRETHAFIEQSSHLQSHLPLLLLTAGSGMGKTRFLQELSYQFKTTERIFVFLNCYHAPDEPYAPWHQVFLQIAPFVQKQADECLFLESFFSSRIFTSDIEPLSTTQPETALRLRICFFKLLRELTARYAVILAWDNLEQISRETLDILCFLKGQLGNKLPLLATASYEAMQNRIMLRSRLEIREISINPLSQEDLKRLLDELTGVDSCPDALRKVLFEKSLGNPGDFLQLIRLLYRQRKLTHGPKRVQWSQSKSIIHQLENSSREDQCLKAMLSAGISQATLSNLTLFEEEISLDEISHLTGHGITQLLFELQPLVDLDYLRRIGPQRFRWAKREYRITLQKNVGQWIKKRLDLAGLHLRLAAYLEVQALQSQTPVHHLERAFYHFLEGGNLKNAISVALSLLDLALKQYLFDRAVPHLDFLAKHLVSMQLEQQKEFLKRRFRFFMLQGLFDEAQSSLSEILGHTSFDKAEKAYFLAESIIFLRQQGRIKDAFERSQEALELIKDQTDFVIQARILAQQGLLLAYLGEKEAGLERINQGLERLSPSQDPRHFANLKNIRANILVQYFEDFPAARKDYHEAIGYFEALDDQAGLASVENNLGLLAEKLHDSGGQKENFEKALKRSRRLGDYRRILYGLSSLGKFQLEHLHLQLAEKMISEGMDLSHILGDRIQYASFLLDQAGLNRLQGRFQDSEGSHLQALDILEQFPHPTSKTLFALISFASLELTLGFFDRAWEIISKAGKLNDQLKNIFFEGHLALLESEYFLQQRLPRKFLSRIEKARELFSRKGFQLQEMECICLAIRGANFELVPIPADAEIQLEKAIEFFRIQQSLRLKIFAELILLDFLLTHQSDDKKRANDLLDKLKGEVSKSQEWQCEYDFHALRFLRLGQQPQLIYQKWAQLRRRLQAFSSFPQDATRIRYAAYLDQLGEDPLVQRQEQLELHRLLKQTDHMSNGIVDLLQGFHLPLTVMSQALRLFSDFFVQEDMAMVIYPPAHRRENKPLVCSRNPNQPLSPTLLHSLATEGEEFFISRTGGQLGGYYCCPLFRREALRNEKQVHSVEFLPLGFLLVQGTFPANYVLPEFERIAPFVCEIIAQSLDDHEKRQKIAKRSAETESLRSQLSKSMQSLRLEFPPERIIVGKSPAMNHVLHLIKRVRDQVFPILIHGESGTGKDLIAKIIHYNSPLSGGPFVSVHCGNLNANLFDSSFFGHVKGSFTGADEDYPGFLLSANGGTLFLDEIDLLPPALQVKLLRVLEEKKFRPLGSDQERLVEFRLLSSSKKSLQASIQEGGFRKDLFFRISSLILEIPPLRERREDIPSLVDVFFQEAKEKFPSPVKKLAASLKKGFENAYWPGNLRQLQNTLEIMVQLTSHNTLTLADLPPDFHVRLKGPRNEPPLPLKKAQNLFFREYVTSILQFTQGHVGKAAELSTLDRKTIFNLKRKYRLL